MSCLTLVSVSFLSLRCNSASTFSDSALLRSSILGPRSIIRSSSPSTPRLPAPSGLNLANTSRTSRACSLLVSTQLDSSATAEAALEMATTKAICTRIRMRCFSVLWGTSSIRCAFDRNRFNLVQKLSAPWRHGRVPTAGLEAPDSPSQAGRPGSQRAAVSRRRSARTLRCLCESRWQPI